MSGTPNFNDRSRAKLNGKGPMTDGSTGEGGQDGGSQNNNNQQDHFDHRLNGFESYKPNTDGTPVEFTVNGKQAATPLIANARHEDGDNQPIAAENEAQLSSDSHPSLVDLVPVHDDMLDFDRYVAGSIHQDRLKKKVVLQDSSEVLTGLPLNDITPLGTPKGQPRRPMRQYSRGSRDGLDDNASRASVYSLYMDRDFRFYFQHPYFRLGIAYLVTFCNFLIYAEDPVAHSEAECFIPVVGNCFAFVLTRYPDNGWAVMKVLIWLLAILFGLVVGKEIIHKLIFNRYLKLKMFTDDQGSWMTMFFSVLFFLFLFSYIYNLFLLMGGDSTLQWRIDDDMGIKNSLFMKAAACGTWCGDLFTAWMVTDVMLQVNMYPEWAPRARKWWNHGYNRVILFWCTIFVTSIVVITTISTDTVNWDRLNHDFLPSNELSRAFMASFILAMDLLIVMQDWDFPHFLNNFDIKLPGVNKVSMILTIPKCMRREETRIHITGKWFNYGIIFFVMILDMNMWKNQIFYDPPLFGQYIGPNKKVHTVRDDWSLYHPNRTMVYDFEWRNTTINPDTNQTYLEGDMIMNSRYKGFSTATKSLAFIPSMFSFICFGVLIWYFGRWKPTEEDPTAGRLKKRKKKKVPTATLR